MMREEDFKPLVGPMGALGISSETSVDFGRERRTATKAPPGEMLMEVANSRESLPFPSRIRIKTGIARCNRAHLRPSFLDKLRCRARSTIEGGNIAPKYRTSGAKRRRGGGPTWNRPKPRHRNGDCRRKFTQPGIK